MTLCMHTTGITNHLTTSLQSQAVSVAEAMMPYLEGDEQQRHCYVMSMRKCSTPISCWGKSKKNCFKGVSCIQKGKKILELEN